MDVRWRVPPSAEMFTVILIRLAVSGQLNTMSREMDAPAATSP
jgi:hypothetical protein